MKKRRFLSAVIINRLILLLETDKGKLREIGRRKAMEPRRHDF